MRIGFIVGVMMFLCSSCVLVDGGVELTKTIWGSSTRALEEARPEAIVKIYDKGYWECLRTALSVVANNRWEVFKKDELKGYLILMGIKGAVNTTEVGVFFVELSDNQARIEISSLSTNAKRKVAKALFQGLDAAFGLAPPNKPLKTAEGAVATKP